MAEKKKEGGRPREKWENFVEKKSRERINRKERKKKEKAYPV
jgi:hypothetical protein